VVDHVLERLPLEGHTEVVHVREVGRRQSARLMHLGEEYFPGRSRCGSPAPHLPLQRPQLPIREPARVTPLQLAQDGFGLETRLVLQQRTNLQPHIGERIDPCHPVMRPGQFARQLLLPPILPCSLLVHVCPRRRYCQRLARRQQATQLPYLFVRDHRKPPSVRDLRIV
jgi:hypothetical protein